jgi:hypothetical protein
MLRSKPVHEPDCVTELPAGYTGTDK